YADALDALGHPEAAIAILAQTARTLPAAQRRSLQQQAAERADRHQRGDLCAEILLEMVHEQPLASALWSRLDERLDRPGQESERAAVLESLAQSSPPEARAQWLVRAAGALARIGSEQATGQRYLWLAAKLDSAQLSAAERTRLTALEPALLRG